MIVARTHWIARPRRLRACSVHDLLSLSRGRYASDGNGGTPGGDGDDRAGDALVRGRPGRPTDGPRPAAGGEPGGADPDRRPDPADLSGGVPVSDGDGHLRGPPAGERLL